MKTKLIYLLMIISTVSFSRLQAQTPCVECDPNSSTEGTYATALGKSTSALGDFSFAAGTGSVAEGIASFSAGTYTTAFGNSSVSLGTWNLSEGILSTTIGSYCKTTANDAIVIGQGISENSYLTNPNSSSLLIGFNSDKPTFYVGPSDGIGRTGKIGIGDIPSLNPQAKLHIYADDNEDATLLLEPSNWTGGKIAKLMLGDSSYWLKTGNSGGFQFNSSDSFTMRVGYVAKMLINSNGIDVRGKTITESFRLYDAGNPPQSGYVLQTDALGNGLWQEAKKQLTGKNSLKRLLIYRIQANSRAKQI
ncbi:MAG: hypothetical protein L3J66_10385 [Bacteroidales bacterium]|nr:hypothetical protein [Bacteroidales bacterium]